MHCSRESRFMVHCPLMPSIAGNVLPNPHPPFTRVAAANTVPLWYSVSVHRMLNDCHPAQCTVLLPISCSCCIQSPEAACRFPKSHGKGEEEENLYTDDPSFGCGGPSGLTPVPTREAFIASLRTRTSTKRKENPFPWHPGVYWYA